MRNFAHCFAILLLAELAACTTTRPRRPIKRVKVSTDGRGFVLQCSVAR